MQPDPCVSQYHLPGFSWDRVGRILVLPVHNESEYTRAGAEVRGTLSAELQQVGRFEVVTPPPDHPACHAEVIHIHGRFDESEMLLLGRTFAADIILHASITQYSPYPRPRLGIVVQAVSPLDGKVVASVDGLFNTSDPAMAQRVRNFYRVTAPRRFPNLTSPALPETDGHAEELALQSPALFQRFVSCEVVRLLTRDP